MRVLLLSVLLLGIAGCGDGSTRQISLQSEADPIAGLEKLGATIGRNEQGEVISVDLDGVEVTDAGPARVSWEHHLLEADGTAAADAGREHLTWAHRMFTTGGTPVINASLRRLKGLESLETLELGNTRPSRIPDSNTSRD